MKKICIIVFVGTMILQSAFSQQKGSYLWFGTGIGPTGMLYKWDGVAQQGSDKLKWGGNVKFGYSYFFTKHVGFGFGTSISCYNNQARYLHGFYQDEYISFGAQVADNINLEDLHDYELRARLINWRENQHALTFDVPLMLQFQWKFGAKEKWGVYFGLGAQFHLPLLSKYYVEDGLTPSDSRLNISGADFNTSGIEYGLPNQPPVFWHGFGSIHNPNKALNWNGKIDMKWSVSGIANLGFIWTLGQNTDLLTRVYVDYGFTNSKKKTVENSPELLIAPERYSSSFENTNVTGAHVIKNPVGTGIEYSGIVNSNRTEKVSLLSYGLEITLRFHLGKGKAPKVEQAQTLPQRVDTVYIVTENNYYIKDSVFIRDTVYLNRIVDIPKEKAANIDSVFKNIEENKAIILYNIYYDFDDTDILPESKKVLDQVVGYLNANPDKKIELSAHTDMRGSAEYNMRLSQRRANSAVSYIISKGIDAARVTAKGYGMTRPLIKCPTEDACTEQEHRSNRRTEIYISDFGSSEILPQTKGKR
jgi:outer membrane protein OmpA-like peptidoglycan-associated protein